MIGEFVNELKDSTWGIQTWVPLDKDHCESYSLLAMSVFRHLNKARARLSNWDAPELPDEFYMWLDTSTKEGGYGPTYGRVYMAVRIPFLVINEYVREEWPVDLQNTIPQNAHTVRMELISMPEQILSDARLMAHNALAEYYGKQVS